MVDPAGLVGPVGGGWSLDWWVGAEDRWYLPARESAVRQTLVDLSPVVETRQRVPGGDVVHRVHAVQGPAELGGREAVVIELTNETPTPVAVALVVRPYAVDHGGSVRRLEHRGGRAVAIDGGWTLLADREASRAAVAADGTDPLAVVTAGEAGEGWEAVDDDDGRASLALIFPLPHTASMRAAFVAGAPPVGAAEAVAGLPGADPVASGWAQQADHGLRIVLPDDSLQAVFAAARRRLLLGAPDLVTDPVGPDQALVGRALAVLGHHDDLRPVVGALLDRQRLSGALPDARGGEAATGAALALLGWWRRFDPRPGLLDELAGPVAKAAHRIRRRAHRRLGRPPAAVGLLPAGPQPAEVGGPTTAYLDAWWSAAGLWEAAALLGAAGQSRAAADADRGARELLAAVRRSVATTGSGLGAPAIPVGPERALDAGMVAILPALAPLAVVDGSEPSVSATVERIRSDLLGDQGWVRSGVAGPSASPWLTACLALHELGRGDERGLDRLDWLVRAGGPTASWPTRLDERGRGRGGRGDEPVATALFLLVVRDLLVRERGGAFTPGTDGLDILPVVPPQWLGAGVELHDAPTTYGRFGFAVRWHGDRPALLWELELAPGSPVPTIAAPGLAPGWSTTDPVGETLLPPPGRTVAAPAGNMMGDESFG
jgi:hypothetical protein